jgi:hypothetical protein
MWVLIPGGVAGARFLLIVHLLVVEHGELGADILDSIRSPPEFPPTVRDPGVVGVGRVPG